MLVPRHQDVQNDAGSGCGSEPHSPQKPSRWQKQVPKWLKEQEVIPVPPETRIFKEFAFNSLCCTVSYVENISESRMDSSILEEVSVDINVPGDYKQIMAIADLVEPEACTREGSSDVPCTASTATSSSSLPHLLRRNDERHVVHSPPHTKASSVGIVTEDTTPISTTLSHSDNKPETKDCKRPCQITFVEHETRQKCDDDANQELIDLRDYSDEVCAVDIFPDSSKLVTVGTDQIVRILRAGSGEQLQTLAGHKHEIPSVAIFPDGSKLVTVSTGNTARIWNAADGKELLRLKGKKRALRGVAVFPDGSKVVTVGADKIGRIWDANTGEELLRLEAHEGGIYGVAVFPDGNKIVTVSRDKTGRIWDAAKGLELRRLQGHRAGVYAVAVFPDGTKVVTVSADNTGRVWNTVSGMELMKLQGHSDRVLGVAVFRDGSKLVTVSADMTGKIWDARTGFVLLTLEGHKGAVCAVAVFPDASRVITVSTDSSVRVWKTPWQEHAIM